jgi:N-acetylglucosamine repressor
MDNTIHSSLTLFNQQRVLYLIRTKGPISRAEIARLTNLTKSTCSKIVDWLEQQSLIFAVGLQQKGRGRPSLQYQFNNASRVAIGVEILGDELLAVVTHTDAQPIRSFSYPLPHISLELILQILEDIIIKVKQEFTDPLLGIGIGLPGICDDQQETVVLSERLHMKDIPLAKMIKERTGITAYVENRANTAALCERWFGLGKDCNNFVYVHIGSGIKASFVLNGTVYPGSHGSAGEMGHLTIVRDGPLCVCGKRGCLETLASTGAILDKINTIIQTGKVSPTLQAYRETDSPLALADVISAAWQGDPIVTDALIEAARYLSIALAHVANLFNPEKIILGPFVNQVPPIYLETIRKTVKEYVFEIPLIGLEILPTQLSQQTVAIGAAAILLSKDLQAMQDELI